MNREQHFQAVMTRARARPNLVVHDELAPLDLKGAVVRASYVVLHDMGADDLGDDRYTSARHADEGRTMRVVARCVGADPSAVRRVASAVVAQLSGWTPIVEGRSCTPLTVDEEGAVVPDRTVNPPLPYIDIDFTYRSDPKGA